MRIALLPSLVCSLAAFPIVASAQSASSVVTVFRVGLPTLNFPGVGSSSFNFASGDHTIGSGIVTGTASAGQGSITAFASAGDFGATANSSGSMAVHSSASLTDSFTVRADTTLPLRLEFGLGASGSVNTVRGGQNPGTPQASVEWSVACSGGSTSFSASGKISESYSPVVIGGVLVWQLIRTETGLGFSQFALVADVGSGTVGQTFSLSMSALARAGYNRGQTNSTTSGTADFGNTLRWLGLTSAKFQDGTPFTGSIQITSASGFDYLTRFSDCPADLNSDGQVDDADFSPFVIAYDIVECADPAMPAGCPADLNNDGLVDDNDFMVFAIAYNNVLCP